VKGLFRLNIMKNMLRILLSPSLCPAVSYVWPFWLHLC